MATQAIFQTQWQTCRKVIERNYMFHREVYPQRAPAKVERG